MAYNLAIFIYWTFYSFGCLSNRISTVTVFYNLLPIKIITKILVQ
jgi:hypothetical protein